jgi:hypothetical protein
MKNYVRENAYAVNTHQILITIGCLFYLSTYLPTYLPTYLSYLIYVSIYGSTALCFALADFLVFYVLHSWQDSLDGESARREGVTCTQDSKNTE